MLLLLTVNTIMLLPVSATAVDGEYLNAGEIISITGATAGSLLVGERFAAFDSTARLVWTKPTGLEKNLMSALGGSYYQGKTNFLDSPIGSACTGLGACITLGLLDLAYPQNDRSQTFLQDQFLFVTGITATKALTAMVKGAFKRRRPMVAMYPDLAAASGHKDFGYNHRSFVSGHSSSAFFSCAFLNIRLRSIMRSEMTDSGYRSWRWAPPTVLYGWAAFVGWTRIHAYQHYPSDVIGGAIVGWLIAELFHRLGEDGFKTAKPTASQIQMLRVSFQF